MDGNLILNLTNASDDNNNSPQIKRQQNAQKKRRSREEASPDSHQPVKKHKKSQHKRKNNDDSAENVKGEKTKRFSSLFRNNPEIPEVDKVKVKSVREDVFSSENFSDLGLHPHLVTGLEKRLKVTKLTAVQRQAIPHVIHGKDVLIKSQTGSGKTLCYAVPIVEGLQSTEPKIQRTDGPYALIISPTRELTLQSYETISTLTQSFVWVVPGLIMGGEKKSKEKARLRKGVNIVLGTPGRLLDHLYNTKSLCVDKLKYLVIDEADRMLDMGFEKEISQILSILNERCPTHKQTILLSATLSQGIERLAGISLENPVKVDIAESQNKNSNDEKQGKSSESTDSTIETFTTPDSLKHHYVIVPSKLRFVTLAAFILWKAKYSSKNKKLVVFMSTQFSVEYHYKALHHLLSVGNTDKSCDVNLFSLHGNMVQKERTRTFYNFTKTDSGVLLCTDVAARGLNLENVRWIVQYNTPGQPTDYIHRVGRTARIGTQGHALLFLTPSEVEYLKVLQIYNISLHELKMDDILKTLLIDVAKWAQLERSTPNTPQECATALQVGVEMYIQGNKDMRTLARKAYQSFIRAYATYPTSMKYIFHVKQLHLGHVAKSFGLQEAPTHIASVVSTNIGYAKKRPYTEKQYTVERTKKPKLDLISEFSSGLDGIDQQQPYKKSLNQKSPHKKSPHSSSHRTRHPSNKQKSHPKKTDRNRKH